MVNIGHVKTRGVFAGIQQHESQQILQLLYFLIPVGQVVYFNETCRISHRGCSVLFCGKFTGNTCARDSFLIKLHTWNFIKKESLAQMFPVNFLWKFLKTPFLQNISGRLLLKRLLLYYFELLFTAICH